VEAVRTGTPVQSHAQLIAGSDGHPAIGDRGDGGRPTAVGPCECVERRQPVQVRRVNASTLALLELCDGRTSVAEIVARMAEVHPDSDMGTVRALRSLTQDRAVRL